MFVNIDMFVCNNDINSTCMCLSSFCFDNDSNIYNYNSFDSLYMETSQREI